MSKMELKKEKDKLALYNKSLPSLKKKQNLLQRQIILFENEIVILEKEILSIGESINEWIAVFAENFDIPKLKTEEILYKDINIAGIELKDIIETKFSFEYDISTTPWWFDDASKVLKKVAALSVKIDNLRKNIEIVHVELNITNQRINLFEKRLIPASNENIRKIKIFLGDQQTAGICRAKITKKKKERSAEQL